MKKIFGVLAIATVLSSVMIGCTKEAETTPTTGTTSTATATPDTSATKPETSTK